MLFFNPTLGNNLNLTEPMELHKIPLYAAASVLVLLGVDTHTCTHTHTHILLKDRERGMEISNFSQHLNLYHCTTRKRLKTIKEWKTIVE